ncbi:membrane-associated proteins in eicosanoid and glutathione metabolism [Trametopsis cervina]|nr:membrane-associated proteins in eicosanoid and glutathione metabolism [Trametopsis cervina]
MTTMITLPQEYAYTFAGVLPIFYVLLWQITQVGKARKAAGIKYPQLYAEKDEADSSRSAKIFNCLQRSHQNTLENLPTALFSTLIAGLRYPRFAGALCGTWAICRVFYTIGYGTGDPNARNYLGSNAISSLSQYALLLAATWTTFQLIIA